MDAPGGAGLTVMTFNLGNGLAPPGRLVDLLRTSPADVVGLQELAPEQAEALRAGLQEAYPHQVLFPTGFSGKGLLSRMPLVTQEQLHLYPDRPDLHVRVETPGGALLVVVAHPPPPRAGWRGFVFDARAVRQIVSLARLAS